MKFEVHVWFATSAGFRKVATFDSMDAAMREGRAYLSDSRAVKVVDSNGVETVIK